MLAMSTDDHDLATFMYHDKENKIRSSHLEHMFEDLFFNRELDIVFADKFSTYCATFFDMDVPIEVYSDFRSALKFVTQFGLVDLQEITPAFSADADFSHCEWQARLQLRGKFSKPYQRDAKPGWIVASTQHKAVLLSFVEFLREITIAQYAATDAGDADTLH